MCTALNWLEAGLVKRSEGHNVIARAAYNARERLVDERTNQVYDYRHLGEPEWKGILDPQHSPDWVLERERLWNAVEQREDCSTRPDQAQLARDFKIALPFELNAEQRLALAKEYAEHMASKGMVVDVAIHAPHAHNDDRNYHAHMLLTMREIGPEGFGNKVRKWNKVAEFDRWMERWSELGAEHLERAGFHTEAERFRGGQMSRPERTKDAHERGDTEEYERLLNEPLQHRGPAASGMEKNGRATRVSDINRQIQERNQVRGIPRDIREAYALSSDPHAFAQTLEQKHMMLARITKGDARKAAAEFAAEDPKYAPQYREGEYVIATEQGTVYRLTRLTTGDSFKGIRDFTKPLNQQDFPSLEAALAEMKNRSRIPSVNRDEVIAQLTPSLPQHPSPAEAAVSAWLSQSLPSSDAAIGVINNATSPQQVRSAYNSVKTPEAFHEALKERNLYLARVTADDASDSKTRHWASMSVGRYYPILTEGEYVAVNNRGQAYRLNKNSVGHENGEVKAFMSSLDQKPMPSLREVHNAVQERRLKEIDHSPGAPKAANGRTRLPNLPGRVGREALRLADQTLQFVTNAFEFLTAPILTPEEKRLAEVIQHERQLALERGERQRGGYDRGR